MTYPPGLLQEFNRTGDFEALRPYLPDGYAYGVFSSDLPVLHAYLLDPDVTAVTEQLAAAGAPSLVDRFRMLVLKQLLLTTERLQGEVWELGVYRGGTAALIRNILAARPAPPTFRLFDTFAGMPESDSGHDLHGAGEFADVSLTAVQALIGPGSFLDYRPGLVPDTFAGLEAAQLRFVHVDLDIHRSLVAALEFIYPRLVQGGIILLDDYGFATCPGAREAIDEYCSKSTLPLVVLPTGQAFLIKH